MNIWKVFLLPANTVFGTENLLVCEMESSISILSRRRRRQQERQKGNRIRLEKQQLQSASASRSFVHFLAVTARLRRGNARTSVTPFLSSPGPLYQNEVKSSAFDVEMIFHS